MVEESSSTTRAIDKEGFREKIVERVNNENTPNVRNTEYLKDKKDKLGHLLSMVE